LVLCIYMHIFANVQRPLYGYWMDWPSFSSNLCLSFLTYMCHLSWGFSVLLTWRLVWDYECISYIYKTKDNLLLNFTVNPTPFVYSLLSSDWKAGVVFIQKAKTSRLRLNYSTDVSSLRKVVTAGKEKTTHCWSFGCSSKFFSWKQQPSY
jgi:hypothetical protein